MKKTILCLLVVALGFASCTQKNEAFDVNISMKNAENLTTYLDKLVGDSLVLIDSAIILNESAAITAPVDDPQTLFLLRFKDTRAKLPFFADNKDVAVIGDLQNPKDIEIIASESQALLSKFNKGYAAFNQQMRDLYPQMEQAYNEENQVLLDSLQAIADSINTLQGEFEMNFIKENGGNFVAHYVLNSKKQDYPLEDLQGFVAGFGAEASSAFLTEINDYITNQQRLSIGQPYLDFALQTADGQNVVLSEKLKDSKYLLVDFWASWCGPCRAENPVVLDAYNQFHDKGFDVLGVSVDANAEDWMNAVAEDQLPWVHVRDAQNEASKMYMVYYIPTNYLLDQNGIIVAKNLRGEELAAKIAELLNK
jgi:Thiol-disulfide isomerase and thioredoxins